MIGHYLMTLTQEQEDRVLTERLAHAPHYLRKDGCRCLVGVTADVRGFEAFHVAGREFVFLQGADNLPVVALPISERMVAARFDDICLRFGETRINAAIRNRILSNQARRALMPEAEPVLVAV